MSPARATRPVYSAPGKAFLLGEYAVLEGAPAVVAAVSCRAWGRFVVGAQPASSLIKEAARAVVGAEALQEEGAVVVDTRSFADASGRKLGTGSSAAAAAVAVAVLRAEVDARLGRTGTADDDLGERGRLFALAHGAHRASQGGVGSGADVAASVFGGVIRFEAATPDVRRLAWPAGLEVVFFSAPASASTPAFIAEVKAYALRAPQAHAGHLRTLRRLSEAGVAAFEQGDARALLSIVHDYGLAMEALGRDAGLPIVTPAFAAASAAAANAGGAAKPSGAGGGDIGCAVFTDAPGRQRFLAALPTLGLTALGLGLDLAGTTRSAPASHESTNV